MSDADPGADPGPDEATGTLIGASAGMALGTVLSRITGMLRDIAIVAAIGLGVFADTYTIANTVPNIVYILIAGGAINAVFVPQLVRAMKGEGGGAAYADRLLTAVALILLAVTVAAVILAPWIIDLYSTSAWSDDDRATATAFARFCLPQIVLYGLFTMFSQVLNSRDRFLAPMYAPIANNLVVIAAAVLFTVVVIGPPTTQTITSGEIALLGLGTTLGIAVQTVLMVPAMARAGYRWRPTLDLRGHGLGKAGRLAGWTFVFVLTNQIAYLVIARLATAANVTAQALADAPDAGFTSYTKAALLFVLPHSVITVSLVTALLPRMSRAAASGELGRVSEHVGHGTALVLAAVLPAAMALIVLGIPASSLLFGFGNAAADDAAFIGVIVAAFAIGLPAYSTFYVLLRGFYALEDTRTPALVNLGMTAVNIAAALVGVALAPDGWAVPALALAYSASYLLTLPVMWLILGRRLGGLPTSATIQTGVRVTLATLTAAVVMVALSWALARIGLPVRVDALVRIVVAGAAGLAVYVAVAMRLRIGAVREVVDVVRGRLGRA